MNARPLMNFGIEKLEEKFKQSSGDQEVLSQIEFELGFRQTLRSRELKAKVLKAKAGSRSSQISEQIGLPLTSDTGVHGASYPATSSDQAALAELQPVPVKAAPLMTAPVNQSVAEMPLEQAVKILGVSLSSNWEQVEKRRRDLVEVSCPEQLASLSGTQRDKAIATAEEANAAARAMRIHAGW